MARSTIRCSRSRRRREADGHLLLSSVVHAGVELALVLAVQRWPIGGMPPLVEAMLAAGQLVATEVLVRALLHRRR